MKDILKEYLASLERGRWDEVEELDHMLNGSVQDDDD